jgi:hypothetical protein
VTVNLVDKIPNDHVFMFDNVDAFLERIHPKNFLRPKSQGRCIFRGQPSNFNLTPSAFRKDYLFRLTRINFGNSSEHYQILHEILALRTFLEASDRQGLLVPGDSQAFREELLSMGGTIATIFNFKKYWPSESATHVLTFAQHSGLPTRLLDWTRRSLIAAYFAATGTAKKAIYEHDEVEPNEDMAVWAFCDEFVSRYKDPEIVIVDVPTGLNQNLVLQRGCFTLVRSKPKEKEAKYMDFEDAVVNNYMKFGGIFPLKKFILRSGQRRRLLKILSECDGIDGASMFGGIDGAMKLIKERAYWFSA